MTEILSLRCHLNHFFLLRSIISGPAHFLVPYIVAYAHAICLRAGCSSAVWPFTSGKISTTQVPNLDPLSIPTGLRGEVDASKRSSGGWRRAFVTGFSL